MPHDRRVIAGYRAVFGAGFVVLGTVTLWRVAASPAPPQSKFLGALLGLAMIGLGIVRVSQYLRARNDSR